MKKIVCLIIILFFASVEAKHIYREKDYQYSWCMKHQGQLEVQLFDYTRADCITNTEVVEFDFASKWAECTGQALYYGLLTDKSPVCILIIEDFKKDIIYFKRLQQLSNKYRFKIDIMTPKDIK